MDNHQCEFCENDAIVRLQGGENLYGEYSYERYSCTDHKPWLLKLSFLDGYDTHMCAMTVRVTGFWTKSKQLEEGVNL